LQIVLDPVLKLPPLHIELRFLPNGFGCRFDMLSVCLFERQTDAHDVSNDTEKAHVPLIKATRLSAIRFKYAPGCSVDHYWHIDDGNDAMLSQQTRGPKLISLSNILDGDRRSRLEGPACRRPVIYR
jgi:hypothetical protein